MKISSWNVNSVRARIINILNYLKDSEPDILMIQEIKAEEKNFPFNDFKILGYDSHKDKNNQSRIIVGDIKNQSKIIRLINIYVPNGNPIGTEKYEYKKNWYNSFIKKVRKTLVENKNIIIGGDFNVIPEEIDVYDYKKYENDALFKIEIRKKFRELINLGFQDIFRYFNKDKQEYTFWDYMSGSWQKNHGMRIDHFLVSNELLNNIKNINIDKKPRSKLKPSDHTPIELEIN